MEELQDEARAITPSQTQEENELFELQEILKREETEAFAREKIDQNLFARSVISIYAIAKEIYGMRCGQNVDLVQLLAKGRALNLKLVQMKAVNRSTYARLDLNQIKVMIEKENLYKLNVELMQRKNEDRHLASEVEKNLQYKSGNKALNEYTMKEFKTKTETKTVSSNDTTQDLILKKDLSSPNVLLSEQDQIMDDRNRKIDLCTYLIFEIMQKEKTIVKKEQKFEKLSPKLRLLNVTGLDIPIEKIEIEDKRVPLLPNPLHITYCNMLAFKQVSAYIGADVVIEIVGDYKEVVEYKEPAILSIDDLVKELHPNEKRKEKKISEKEKQEILAAHPLSISLFLISEHGVELKIYFYYIPHLQIMTVKSIGSIPSTITASTARAVLASDSILNELFEGDHGIDSPRPSNNYIFKKLNIQSYQPLIGKLGFAFIWAQHLAGIDYDEGLRAIKKKTITESRRDSRNILIVMERKFITRVSLAMELEHLEQDVIPTIPSKIKEPLKIPVSKLTKFKSITYDEYCKKIPRTGSLVYLHTVSSRDFFYDITISNQERNLSVTVVIDSGKPVKYPSFLLCFGNEEIKLDELFHMERALKSNLSSRVEINANLLSLGLKFLCSDFDLLVNYMQNPTKELLEAFYEEVGAKYMGYPDYRMEM